MWYLTILYLYVNINTRCCITNGIKKGMTSVLDVWELHLYSQECCSAIAAMAPSALQGQVSAVSRRLSRDGAVVLLTRAHAGHPNTPLKMRGRRKDFSSALSPEASETKHDHKFTASTLFFSLQETCLIWVLKEWKLQVGFPAAGAQSSREYLSGEWFMLSIDTCYTVYLLQHLAFFPSRNTETF